MLAVLIKLILSNGYQSVFVSPCPPECNFQSETKIEPDLRLTQLGKDNNGGQNITSQNLESGEDLIKATLQLLTTPLVYRSYRVLNLSVLLSTQTRVSARLI